MKVSELMATNVRTCSPESGLHDVAQVMWEQNCGVVPIVDAVGHPVGILTDRDLAMTAYLRGKPLYDVKAKEVMSIDVHCCKTTDPIDVPRKLMMEHRVKRIPVLNEKGLLAGILTLNDLSRAAGLATSSSERKRWAQDLADAYVARTPSKTRASDLLQPATTPSPPAEGPALLRKRASVR
jgi:CBS domain-containing protein